MYGSNLVFTVIGMLWRISIHQLDVVGSRVTSNGCSNKDYFSKEHQIMPDNIKTHYTWEKSGVLTLLTSKEHIRVFVIESNNAVLSKDMSREKKVLGLCSSRNPILYSSLSDKNKRLKRR